MIAEEVATLLDAAGVWFEPLPHARTETAHAEARALGVAADSVAKTIVLAPPEGHARVVLPASERLDVRKVHNVLGLTKRDVSLLSEDEFSRDYPEFDLGTVPPFAGAHADRVLVDCRLVDHEQLVLEAGTHDASLRMRTSDLLDLTKGQVLDICQD